MSDRGEAAVTISYEAQARLQDPIHGCVSHIFALQQQVDYIISLICAHKPTSCDFTWKPNSNLLIVTCFK